jgi:AmmeMemoRadiSam system protein B
MTAAIPDAIRKLLDSAGIPPRDGCRGQLDTRGFPSTAGEMDAVLEMARELARPRHEELAGLGLDPQEPFLAGVCPHDDYVYAARLYALLLPHIRARTVLLFGVFHRARLFGIRDRLVFDAYERWHGPYGDIPVSSLRGDVLARLRPDSYVVDDTMHMAEHSVEAILPFLQALRRDVEILPVLVPYMDWERLQELARELAGVLQELMGGKGWEVGRDLAILCSADAVHYGDMGWDGMSYAPFGTRVEGYRMAVARDLALARDLLGGPLEEERLEAFLHACVDPRDVTRYRVTWCGRFSIPFGLRVLLEMTRLKVQAPPEGLLLDYGTSLSEYGLDPKRLDSIGATAPASLRHWVGYAALGWRTPPVS